MNHRWPSLLSAFLPRFPRSVFFIINTFWSEQSINVKCSIEGNFYSKRDAQAATLTLNLGFESHEWQKRKNSLPTKLLSLRKGYLAEAFSSQVRRLFLPFFSHFLFILASFLPAPYPCLSISPSSAFSFLFTFPPFALPIRLLLLTTTKLNTTPGKSPRKLLGYSEASWMHCHFNYFTRTVYRHGRRRRRQKEARGKMHKRKRRNEIFDLANGSRIKKHFFFSKEIVNWDNPILSFQSRAFLKMRLLILMTPSRVTQRFYYIYRTRRAHSLKPCISPIYLQPFATYALPICRHKYVLSQD